MAAAGPGEIEIYRSANGSEMAVVAATWHLQPKVRFEDLAHFFKDDEAKAWRNYGSKVKGGVDTDALKDKTIVNAQANRTRLHPWNEDRQEFEPWFRGEPGVNYFIHIDLAKNHDAAGIALGHKVRRSSRVVLDFLHAVHALGGRDIQIADVRNTFVYGLTARGFRIKGVSYDQWQSLESQQELAARGYEVKELSADKTKAPYDTLIGLLKANNLDYYLHPQFIREMEKLKKYDKKYDHPSGGSKDVADAAACVVFNLLEDAIENPHGDAASGITVHRAPQTERPGYD